MADNKQEIIAEAVKKLGKGLIARIVHENAAHTHVRLWRNNDGSFEVSTSYFSSFQMTKHTASGMVFMPKDEFLSQLTNI